LLDRLLHPAHRIELQGESLRRADSKKTPADCDPQPQATSGGQRPDSKEVEP